MYSNFSTNRKIPNNLLDALRRQNSPMIDMNSEENVVPSQGAHKSFSVFNARRRRSYKNNRNTVSSSDTVANEISPNVLPASPSLVKLIST